jgi:PLD-like domain
MRRSQYTPRRVFHRLNQQSRFWPCLIIIDGETVLTGSFNFTKAAQEKNAENLLVIRDPAVAAQYTQNWEAHRQHSQPYVGRGVR